MKAPEYLRPVNIRGPQVETCEHVETPLTAKPAEHHKMATILGECLVKQSESQQLSTVAARYMHKIK